MNALEWVPVQSKMFALLAIFILSKSAVVKIPLLNKGGGAIQLNTADKTKARVQRSS